MKLVADENIPVQLIAALRESGHAVVSIAERSPSIVDEEVLETARAEDAVLLTDDKDFGELVVRRGLDHRGVVLLRLAGVPVRERS